MAHKGPTQHRYATVQIRDWDDHARLLGRPDPHPHTLLMWLRVGPFAARVPGLVLGGRAAMAEALDWSPDCFDSCFQQLEAAGLVIADWSARVVVLPWVVKQECNRPTSTSQVVGWRKVLADAPACELVRRLERDLRGAMSASLRESFSAGKRADSEKPAGLAGGLPGGLPSGLAGGLAAPLAEGLAGGLHEHEQEQEHEHPLRGSALARADEGAPGTGRAPGRAGDPLPPALSAVFRKPRSEHGPVDLLTLLEQEGKPRLIVLRQSATATGLAPHLEHEFCDAALRAKATPDDMRRLGKLLQDPDYLWKYRPTVTLEQLLKEGLQAAIETARRWDGGPVRKGGAAPVPEATPPGRRAKEQQDHKDHLDERRRRRAALDPQDPAVRQSLEQLRDLRGDKT